MRGNLATKTGRCSIRRSIPARAGEPSRTRIAGMGAEVYPRACGGTSALPCWGRPPSGLSPRVRGNLYVPNDGTSVNRSIPARAGEPLWWPVRFCCPRVYPRACGGTSATRGAQQSSDGLSPRVRGNPTHWENNHIQGGSIPARAGEPSGKYRRTVVLAGLSPRVRGNQSTLGKSRLGYRSIPARAGEPLFGTECEGT